MSNFFNCFIGKNIKHRGFNLSKTQKNLAKAHFNMIWIKTGFSWKKYEKHIKINMRNILKSTCLNLTKGNGSIDCRSIDFFKDAVLHSRANLNYCTYTTVFKTFQWNLRKKTSNSIRINFISSKFKYQRIK